MENKIEWLKVRFEYLVPVFSVLLFASALVYFTYLAEITIKAVVIAEEGGGSQQAQAGILNALIYILPAIAGGFLIAMLFKYQKKNMLKIFFGGAIFFATAFISFFFFEIILYVLQLKSIGVILFSSNSVFSIETNTYRTYIRILDLIIIPISILMGVLVAYIISSHKIIIETKNSALLFLGGLMGAFMAVILPTWTVVFMLVGLSLYDIYSVKRGPIREIMELTYGPPVQESKAPSKTMPLEAAPGSKEEQVVQVRQTSVPVPPAGDAAIRSSIAGHDPTAVQQPTASEAEIKATVIKQPQVPQEYLTRDEDDLLSNMTYGTANWDLGIGDLVFYSMLGSHTLLFGTRFIPDFGYLAPIILFLATTLGILVGFVITLRLLQRNSMLPGLPLSISFGLIGFGIVAGIFFLISP